MYDVHVGGCDLAFMVDVSSSISGEANFKLVMEFVKSIFHSFTMSASLRFGLVVFGGSVKVQKNWTEILNLNFERSVLIGGTDLYLNSITLN